MKSRSLINLVACCGFLLGQASIAPAQEDAVAAMLDKLVPSAGVSVLLTTEAIDLHFRKKFNLPPLPADIDLTKETVVEFHLKDGCFANNTTIYRINDMDKIQHYDSKGNYQETYTTAIPSQRKHALGIFWTGLMKVRKFGKQPTDEPYQRSIGPPNIIIITHHPQSPPANRMFFLMGGPPHEDRWTDMMLGIMGAPTKTNSK